MIPQSWSMIVSGVFFVMGGLLLGIVLCNKAFSMASTAAANFSIAYITGPSESFAKGLAREMVKSKLVACVNIIPKVLSIYRWEKKINEDEEVLMMVKTRTSRIPDLIEFVKTRHTYDVCEIIAVPITQGHDKYLKWISEMVPAESEHDKDL